MLSLLTSFIWSLLILLSLSHGDFLSGMSRLLSIEFIFEPVSSDIAFSYSGTSSGFCISSSGLVKSSKIRIYPSIADSYLWRYSFLNFFPALTSSFPLTLKALWLDPRALLLPRPVLSSEPLLSCFVLKFQFFSFRWFLVAGLVDRLCSSYPSVLPSSCPPFSEKVDPPCECLNEWAWTEFSLCWFYYLLPPSPLFLVKNFFIHRLFSIFCELRTLTSIELYPGPCLGEMAPFEW